MPRRAGEKRHMQSLGALAHFDFNGAEAYANEQTLLAIRSSLRPAAVHARDRRDPRLAQSRASRASSIGSARGTLPRGSSWLSQLPAVGAGVHGWPASTPTAESNDRERGERGGRSDRDLGFG